MDSEAFLIANHTSIWKVAPGEKASLWEMCQQEKCIVIGWLNDVDYRRFPDKNALRQALGKEKGGVSHIWSFVHSMQRGDVVVANQGRRTVVGVGAIASDYIPPDDDDNPSTNSHYTQARHVDWLITKSVEIPFQFIVGTVDKLTPQEWKQIYQAYLSAYPDDLELKNSLSQLESLMKLTEIPEVRPEQQPVPQELKQLIKIAERTRNIILYGPPGTGKTYWVRRFSKFFLAKQLQVPISPEQRRQEILQSLNWYGVIALTLYLHRQQKRLFRASELGDDSLIHEYWKLTNTKKLDNMIQAMLQSHTDPSVKTVLYAKRCPPYLFEKNDQKQWWLTEAGQEYVEENLSEQLKEIKNPKQIAPDLSKYIKIVTFHQAFAYEEFIEGLKPTTDVEGQVRYEVIDGVFKSICKQAELDPEHRYLLIVDEINRANIAKVIGELITLIEDDKRIGERNELIVTLPYSGQKFGVPSNLYILGTMNTADRSIALLDIAIRRRFAFVELMPNPSLLKDKDIDGVQLDKLLAQLNHRIVALLSHDYQIGHSYFLDVNDIEDLHFTWYHRVIPLLQEYFYNDGQRLQALIGEDFIQPVEVDSATQKALKNLYEPDFKYEIRQLAGERFLDALRKLAK
ncbi:AAA family ATPase [Coleofasciculus sp. FACHB-501]|uniref:AAA family ATPase n=1 Tax=Cyanophyceae TaxID=3028117 RepID=UPI001682E5BC|nr:AAA family ATPase [Coleofasciculus sp. FACHB-501]MBD1838893.1 AAA family ATPase [Coleofasciculus sp. FACHB-501]